MDIIKLYFPCFYFVTHIELLSSIEEIISNRCNRIIKFQGLVLKLNRFYRAPYNELHVRLLAFGDVSMMLKEHKRIHIFYRLKGYWNTRIHTCTLTNTQIMQLEMGDGMCGENAFLFCNNLSLYLMHYHINRINSTPIAHSNHNRKEDKSRLVRIYLSMFGRIDLISEWFIFSILDGEI